MGQAKKRKVAGLLKRFEFTDFAGAVAAPKDNRKHVLRTYLNRNSGTRWPSYKGFRSIVPDIFGARRGLDPTPPLTLQQIERGLKERCHRDDLDRNVEVARTLFNYVRAKDWTAYADHARNPLYIAPDRTIPMRIEHYVVEGDRGAFQFVNPRRRAFTPDALNIAMSLIHYNYVRDDFEGFDVEVVDLSCPDEIGPRGGIRQGPRRQARTHRLTPADCWDRDQLNVEADTIYELLLEIADEPDDYDDPEHDAEQLF